MNVWDHDRRFMAHRTPHHPRLRLAAECAAFLWIVFLVVAAMVLGPK